MKAEKYGSELIMKINISPRTYSEIETKNIDQ